MTTKVQYGDIRISTDDEVTCALCDASLHFRVVANTISRAVSWRDGEGQRITQDLEMIHHCAGLEAGVGIEQEDPSAPFDPEYKAASQALVRRMLGNLPLPGDERFDRRR